MKNKELLIGYIIYFMLLGFVVHATMSDVPFFVILPMLCLTGIVCWWLVVKITAGNGEGK